MDSKLEKTRSSEGFLQGQRRALILVYLFFGIFLLTGLKAVFDGLEQRSNGNSSESLLVGSVFTLLGLVGIPLSQKFARYSKEVESLKKLYPDSPWKWRKDWAQGFSRPTELNQSLIILGFGVIWTLLSSPVLLQFAQKRLPVASLLTYWILAFPLIGVLMIFFSLRMHLRNKRLGQTRFLFGELGVIGGSLSGQVILAQRLPEGLNALLRLSHIKTTSGAGSNDSSIRSIAWQKEMRSAVQSGGLETLIDVNFEIPFETQPTFFREQNSTYSWNLEVEITELQTKQTFEIPVFKTEKSNAAISIQNEKLDPEFLKQGLEPTEFDFQNEDSQLRVQFKRNGTRKGGLVLGLAGGFFLGAGVFMGVLTAKASPLLFVFSLIVPVVFSGVGAGMVLLSLIFAFQRVELVAGREGLKSTNRVFGLRWGWSLDAGDFRKISLKPGMQQGAQVWYDLQVECRSGRPKTVSCSIRDKNQALWLVEKVGRTIRS